MPGYIIHLAEAKLILERLNQLNPVFQFSAEWKNLYFCGALLPDAVNKSDKEISHFRTERTSGRFVSSPDLDYFLRKWQLSFHDPLVLGYYVHLHLDSLFLTALLPSLITILDKRDPLEDSRILLQSSGEIVSFRKLFSKDYIYTDYTLLNQHLINHFQLSLPHYTPVSGIISPVALDQLPITLNKLQGYLSESSIQKDSLKVLSRSSLEQFLHHTASDVAAHLSTLRLC